MADIWPSTGALADPELRAAWLRSLKRLPTTLLGGPVDLANMAIGGLDYLGGGKGKIKASEKPVGGSQWLAELVNQGIPSYPTEPGSPNADLLMSVLAGPGSALAARGAGAVESALLNAKPGPVAGSPAAQIGAIGGKRGGGKKGGVPPEVPPPAPEIPVDPAAQLTAEGLNKAARAKRIVGTTKQYVGAPPGIDSPAKFNKQIDDYVARIKEARDNGVRRGYFYKEGTDENRLITNSPYDANRLAMLEGTTSSEAPVQTNTGWAIKGIEQQAMGAPVHTGKYPNATAEKNARVLAGDFSHIGEKTHRYGAGLAGDVKGKAPNDRWEIRSFGYEGDTAGPAQHAYMDEVRQRAIERYNQKYLAQGEAPLSILEGQEFNWATQRSRDMGIPHAQAAEALSDALRAHIIQHSWESRGGQKSGHFPEMTSADWPGYHQEVKNVVIDPATGKDRLVENMGGRLQYPAIDGPGVYEGVVSPGTQSRSLGYLTQAHGLDPTTAARVGATEAARAFGLGQDAYAFHGYTRPNALVSESTGKFSNKSDLLDINYGRTISTPEAVMLESVLKGTYGADNAGIVPTANGARILKTGDVPKFATTFQSDVQPQLTSLLGGVEPRITPMVKHGDYATLDWTGKNATRDFLATLDNPSAPNLRQYADAPAMRDWAGQLAALYELKQAQGFTPTERLIPALRAWQSQGLFGLEDLVKKGLAPAIGGYGLSELLQRPDEQQGYQ